MEKERAPEFKKSLGLFDATMIVSGSMIGSGIFIVSSDMARAVGSAGYLLLLWIMTGFITVFAALSYGELAGMMPEAGGQFVYIRRAFGRLTAFLYGWTVFTVIQTGVVAAVAVAFSKYAGVFFPVLTQTIPAFIWPVTYGQLLAMALIIFLTWINTKGVGAGKLIQTFFTSAKLLSLAGLIILGFWAAYSLPWLKMNFENGWAPSTLSDSDGKMFLVPLAGFALMGAMGATIINSLFSCDAWNNVTFIAGEIKDPRKNIPRSLFLGTVTVTVLYVLANFAYLSLLPINGSPDGADAIGRGISFAEQDRIGSAAVSVVFGDSAAWLLAGLIMVSTFGCNNGLILAGARVYWAMAREKLFFRGAGTLNAAGVPSRGLWFQCAWACLLCLSGTYKDLVSYATFASMIFYIVTILGLFVLRKKEPTAFRPYKAFGYPWIPAFYVVAAILICCILIVYDGRNTGFGLLCVALGVPVYFLIPGLREKNPPATGI